MDEPSDPATEPSPWASPGSSPARPSGSAGPPGSPGPPGSAMPGYRTPNQPPPTPSYGPPGPGYEASRIPAPTGHGQYTFPSLQKQPVEPLAIASVIASPIAPVGLGLGIAAQRRIKRSRRRGGGLASTGIILSTLFLIAGLLVVGTLTLDGTFARLAETPVAGDVSSSRTGSPVNLDVGNCVATMPVTTEVGEVTLVPCAEEHQLQVIARTPIEATEYAGPEALHAQAADVCQAAFENVNAEVDSFIPWHLVPSEANWAAGERNLICFARSTAGAISGSLFE